ncbi:MULTISPECIES: 3-phenylpropionate/cinnamic acid dioxygenase subunit beta [Brevundimonas]|jgi:3-phenylpropionate/cinnamic acid dioxygenase small subunit|uniref:3-phenylpropionate/cinnamic acid dioxygenase small subunit n=1 Tax=Brevundimonas bullata TaxID=13160 RepID=A0A7W7ISP2_9CAUL|nr:MULTISPECIES: 3-phenylpropionate/cinnamic acid dioxygenase subunit beta [Brevundimonas]MBB4799796.1 3-phenylpropionate/cinnamic acid dioxygenase small subunit [Brevundimonas bullata]MBB6384754.1 3-phenylpropionate/cinnamic acid dioxygenase small subunit [Brevundimonas bullata]
MTMNAVIPTDVSVASDAPFRPNRVPVGSPAYNEITEFLYEEAWLLDEIRLAEWVARLDVDLRYTCPVRQTRPLHQHAQSIVRTVMHFDETYASIRGRVGRITDTRSAWAEDPPSRTRRLVTNILVDSTDDPDEFEVKSYLLCSRSRFEETNLLFLSCVRHDLLRRYDDGIKLARREIIVDQTVLGFPNLAIFL